MIQKSLFSIEVTLLKMFKNDSNFTIFDRGRKKVTSEIFSKNRLEGGGLTSESKIPDFF